MTIRIGIDTGGTFTDVVLFDEESGTVYTTKTPSTPPNFDRGVLGGLDKILKREGYSGPDVAFLSHGTTVGTNAILEGEIPDLGLLTNDGLRDVLEIGDQTRPELYNLQTDKPPALIPRYLRKEVPGRIDSQGNEVEPLDIETARETVRELAGEDIEAIVVSLLFSYLNDDHERAIGDLIEAETPGMDYALSSAVHPEIREYDRTITTVLNQGIKSTVQDYFARLDEGANERRIAAPFNIMHSGGGLFSTDQATEKAIRTVLSGPAAGAVAAKTVSNGEGYPDAIGMDMGGTSADVSIIRGGEIVRSTDGEINDLPIKSTMIDISTVGAGGGSIAWIDDGGALRVGPKSAGADPGPICYGNGGEEPTVTDANLILGRINPGNFLEGEMELAIERTRDVFRETIADPLGQSLEDAAVSVIDVANASLAREIRRVTIERGNDPADFALVAFGGAGPLQAPAVAEEMDMEIVIIPRSPGVFSARGLLIADVRIDESHAYRGDVVNPSEIDEQFGELETTLLERFREQGFDGEETTLERQVDVRYVGQSYEITVTAPPGTFDESALEETTRRFHEKHERLYGHAIEDEPIEVVAVRMNGHVPTTPLRDSMSETTGDAEQGQRDVYFDSKGFVPTTVYERTHITPGTTITGPAILEESGSTSIVHPGSAARVSEDGSLVVSF